MEKQPKTGDMEKTSLPPAETVKQPKTRDELAQLVAAEMTASGLPTDAGDIIIIPSGAPGTDILKIGKWRAGAQHGRTIDPARVAKRDEIASTLNGTYRLKFGDRSVIEEPALIELIENEAARRGHKVKISLKRHGPPGSIVQNWSGTTVLEDTEKECAPMVPYLMALSRHFDLK
jgi:hypothetical protein